MIFRFLMHSLPDNLCLADLKKTLAVLLDNIMLRLGKLEAKVENIYNGTGANMSSSTSTATPSVTNVEKVNVAGRYYVFCCCLNLSPSLNLFHWSIKELLLLWYLLNRNAL